MIRIIFALMCIFSITFAEVDPIDQNGNLIMREVPKPRQGTQINPNTNPALNSPTIPTIDLSLSVPKDPGDLVTTLNIVIIITLLVLAPSLILVMTSFVRIVIVLGFLRVAMGTQQSPPTQILVSLALILTFFIMEPVATDGYNAGIKPYINKEIFKAMDDYEKAGEKIVILDAPTLIENNLHTYMDYIIVVWVDNNTQIIRLKNRDRLSRDEAINRLNAQLSLDKKRGR